MTSDKPLSRIAATWEPLADLMRRVFQVFGLEGDDLERYVIERLRNGPSYLRITGGSVRMIQSDGRDGPRVIQSHEWEQIFPPDRVFWDLGYVLGPDEWGDPPPRFPIEFLWRAAVDAVSAWKKLQQRNAEAYAARARLKSEEASPEPVPDPPRRGGGRRRKYDWPYVMLKLIQKLQDDGIPKEGDGGQAELERFVTDLFSPDNCPSASVIREWVSDTIEAFRRDLG